MEKIKTLFFAADAASGRRLMIEEEIRTITKKIRAAEYSDSIELIPALAVRPDDLLQTLNEHKPQIVHFSTHGEATGELLLLDRFGYPKRVSPNAIQALFKTLGENIWIVLLNACYSKLQARAIIKVIDCAIGIGNPIPNKAAIAFAASFYRAVGFGRSVKEAFEQGRTALLLEGIAEENIPELLVKEGVDPSRIFLLEALPPPPPPGLIEQGLKHLELQNYGEAFELFQEARESMPGNEKVQFLYCLSFLSGKPILSIKKSNMNEVTGILKKIAHGEDLETANLARMVLNIIWFDYYVKEDHRYQELFFKENTRYLMNYQPGREEKELVSHIVCSDSAKTLTRLR